MQINKNIYKLLLTLAFISNINANENKFTNILSSGYEIEYLSNNYDNWSNYFLEYSFIYDKKFSIALKGEKTSRYGLNDKNSQLNLVAPLFSSFNWEGMISKADEGLIIPKSSIYNKLSYANNLLNLSFSAKNNNYDSGAQSDIYSIDLIKYISQFRLAYSSYKADVKDAGTSISHKGTIHYFYKNNYTAFSYATGKELEALANGSVLSLNVDSFIIYGQYYISKEWGCNYSFSYTKQDELYAKKGALVAAFYKF